MARPDLLKLRSLGDRDYSMLQGRQRIGRIRYASERWPPVWIWNVTIHLTGELPIGSAQDLETAKAEFRAAWEALKTRTRRPSPRRRSRRQTFATAAGEGVRKNTDH